MRGVLVKKFRKIGASPYSIVDPSTEQSAKLDKYFMFSTNSEAYEYAVLIAEHMGLPKPPKVVESNKGGPLVEFKEKIPSPELHNNIIKLMAKDKLMAKNHDA